MKTNANYDFGDAIRKLHYRFIMDRLEKAAKAADDEWLGIFGCDYDDPKGPETFTLRRR